jgi:hypothetical protein
MAQQIGDSSAANCVKKNRQAGAGAAVSEPFREAEVRLRFAFPLVKTLMSNDDLAVVQAWVTVLSPELNDHSPIPLLRVQI